MTLWELAACVDGYNEAHGAEAQPEPPTDEEHEEMKRRRAELDARQPEKPEMPVRPVKDKAKA